jgi:hypothetical protein
MKLNICKKLKLRAKAALRSQAMFIRSLRQNEFHEILFPVLICEGDDSSFVVSSLIEYVVDVDISIFGIKEKSFLIDSNCRKYQMVKQECSEMFLPRRENSEITKQEIFELLGNSILLGKKFASLNKSESISKIFDELYQM